MAATVNLEIQHPNIPKYYQLKKDLHENLGRALRAQGQLAEAETCYQRAVQMQRLLIAHMEDPTIHETWLLWLQQDYGRLLYDAGKLDEADTMLKATALGLKAKLADERLAGWRFSHRESRQQLEKTYRTLKKVAHRRGDEALSAQWEAMAEELDR